MVLLEQKGDNHYQKLEERLKTSRETRELLQQSPATVAHPMETHLTQIRGSVLYRRANYSPSGLRICVSFLERTSPAIALFYRSVVQGANDSSLRKDNQSPFSPSTISLGSRLAICILKQLANEVYLNLTPITLHKHSSKNKSEQRVEFKVKRGQACSKI
ncbi:hypothetical protein OUZ56_017297 [Daphnia magna]|uniref:Uncharacterized protein n=1 Tax=Daphnia magna TaxID=35525 RepID=A0ABR0ASM6_9CRUS|nr:hypothetical protein OUZ56_017297 [Daphnia magna]